MVEDPLLCGPHWVSQRLGGTDPIPRKPAAEESGGAPKTANEWVAWVMADPDDLGRRAPWADWLLERGDPRGELLALQLAERALTPKENKRVASLVKAHGMSWIGKLKGVADQLEFERGVLTGCRIAAVPEGRVAPDDPHWATIERMTVPSYTVAPVLAARLLKCVPRLTALEEPSPAFLMDVMRAGAPRLERVGFDVRFHVGLPSTDLELLAKAKLPALRGLRVGGQPGNAVVSALVGLPWFGQLERLVVDGGRLDERLAAVAATKLPRLDVLVAQNNGWEPTGAGFSYRATRAGETKWKLEVIGLPERVPTVPPDSFYESSLIPALAQLQPGVLSELTLLVLRGFEASSKVAKKVAAQIARLIPTARPHPRG